MSSILITGASHGVGKAFALACAQSGRFSRIILNGGSDTAALEAFVDQAIAANPNVVADYKAGKKAAAGFFVGQVMKLSKGKADPKTVGPMIAKKLSAM